MNETDFKNYGFFLAKDLNELLKVYNSSEAVEARQMFSVEPVTENAITLLKILLAQVREIGAYRYEVTSQRNTYVLKDSELVSYTKDFLDRLKALEAT